MAVVPVIVYEIIIAFQDPPPHYWFNAAAVISGVLTEILLIKCLTCYCSRKYNKAEMSSFSVRARTVEHCDTGICFLWPAGQAPSTAVVSRTEAGKQEAVKTREDLGLKLCV
nr:PREDICTED: uncharacterized protein LOC106705958 [Latimeria chalumnae]|eukprot:XP_014351650.1 PREDICTED: uncharacterized protein LOC106705958 [Latimeria chalumnae]